MKKQIKKWVQVDSAIGKVQVYTVAEPELENEPVRGAFFVEHNAIIIDSTQTQDKMRSTLLHELLHVAVASASDEVQKMCLGMREEKIVSFFEPILYDLLSRNGYLKLPRKP